MNNSHQIDRAKLTEKIEAVADICITQDKDKLKLYTKDEASHKEFINQLIINGYVVRLLDLKEATDTKAGFKKIRKVVLNLLELAQSQHNHFFKFSVNRSKLEVILRTYKIKTCSTFEEDTKEKAQSSHATTISNETENSFSQDTESIPLESLNQRVLLTRRSGANIELLINAIEAYAFNQHVVDADVTNLDIVTKQRIQITLLKSIRRFLKLDLKRVGFGGKGLLLGFGIGYKIIRNVLYFHGTADENIKDKTLAVQVVNLKGRIIRELWIYGVDADAERDEALLSESHQEHKSLPLQL